jgi:hypothetical protein
MTRMDGDAFAGIIEDSFKVTLVARESIKCDTEIQISVSHFLHLMNI